MIILWPESLPSMFLHNGYSEQLPDNLQRTFILKGGAEPTRRITTSNPRMCAGNMVMTLEQVITLETFYNTTLGYGALFFYMPYYVRGLEMLKYYHTKFSQPPSWSLVGEDSWTIQLSIEVYTNRKPLVQDVIEEAFGGVTTPIGGIGNG